MTWNLTTDFLPAPPKQRYRLDHPWYPWHREPMFDVVRNSGVRSSVLQCGTDDLTPKPGPPNPDDPTPKPREAVAVATLTSATPHG